MAEILNFQGSTHRIGVGSLSDLLVKKETYENKLIQLKNQGKKLEKMASIEERKKRTHRLIERGAILESFIEDASELSGAEIKFIYIKACIL